MRTIFSYGAAGVVVVIIAAWLATGTLVIGGRGAGNGERPIISLFEEEDGPITRALDESGLAVETATDTTEADPSLSIAQRVAQASDVPETPTHSVRTETFTVQPMAMEVPLRGRTRAKSVVTVTPETQGLARQIHVEKGQRVEVGDLICTLEGGTRAAALAQAEASLAQAEADFETNASLRERGLSPANSARSFEVALRAAEAAVENARTELERTEVRTQVAGVVQDPMGSVGSVLGPGAPCATVVELDPMLFVGSVPEARIGLAEVGLPASITVITGQTVEGKVSYISPTADASTRTFPVEVEIENASGRLRDGLTAEATINLGTTPAHLLPQSVLTLDDDGVLGIRAVEDGTVTFRPVTVLSDTRQGVWVSGLPDSIDVITVGQEYVVAGQRIGEPAVEQNS